MSHKCKALERQQLIQTVTGQVALNYYQLWFKAQGKIPPSGTTFMTSKSFKTFITFVEFVTKVDLVNVERFIKLMVLKKFPPSMWCLDEVYTMYMEFLDKQVAPLEHVRTSVDTLIKLADKHECDVSEVFNKVPFHLITHKIRTRRLSPWILLYSRSFKQALDSADAEQKTIAESLIRVNYWVEKRQEHKDIVPDIKKIVTALGI